MDELLWRTSPFDDDDDFGFEEGDAGLGADLVEYDDDDDEFSDDAPVAAPPPPAPARPAAKKPAAKKKR